MFGPRAIETWTSLVEIKSTTIPYLSRIKNVWARKPWELVRLLEWTFMTTTLSLIVTAVGCFEVGDFSTSPPSGNINVPSP